VQVIQMPLIVEPIEVSQVVEQIQVQSEPVVQKALGVELNDMTVAYIMLGMFAIFLFRSLFFPLLTFIFKIGIVALFSFATYVMFFT
jgi:hypothetical protein